MVSYTPNRGDFIRLNFDPQAGHEQMGNRPALVVSHRSFNQKMGFIFVCPVSNTQRKNPVKSVGLLTTDIIFTSRTASALAVA